VNTTTDPHQESRPIEPTKYLHLLGTLMYLTRSRPDILTATSYASTRASNPTEKDYDALLRIVDYLATTPDYGLILHRHPLQPLQLTCYVDASYLSHGDSKSHTGYFLSFGPVGSFHAKSIKQPLLATSSTHAEAKALYSLILDIQFIKHLCDDIGFPLQLPVTIFEDNNPVIQLTSTGTGKKSKHYAMLLAYIKEQIQMGLIRLYHIATTDNPADTLTKPLQGDAFQRKTKHLMGST
jgi:hypothetical protein